MIKQIRKQQTNVNDNCADCGSFVDIGAVVEEQDTVLQLSFTGDEALTEAQMLQHTAKQRFSGTKTDIKDNGLEVSLVLDFAFSAEKMIFQLENQL